MDGFDTHRIIASAQENIEGRTSIKDIWDANSVGLGGESGASASMNIRELMKKAYSAASTQRQASDLYNRERRAKYGDYTNGDRPLTRPDLSIDPDAQFLMENVFGQIMRRIVERAANICLGRNYAKVKAAGDQATRKRKEIGILGANPEARPKTNAGDRWPQQENGRSKRIPAVSYEDVKTAGQKGRELPGAKPEGGEYVDIKSAQRALHSMLSSAIEPGSPSS